MSEPAPDSLPGPPPAAERTRPAAQHYRWQALFQRTADALFLLDRRRRILFVNRAWEALTGVPAAQAHGLPCRRPRPVAPADPWEQVLAHALTPPPEAAEGQPARVRRLLPGREARQWWEIEFLPLRQEGGPAAFVLLGRIRVLGAEPAGSDPLPERLANLRLRACGHHSLDAWEASTLPAARRLLAQVRLAATVATPVLLVGEAGSGKESLARIIHARGPAAERSFAALDCRRLPPALLAAVLFGPHAALGALYLREPAALPGDLQLRLCEWLARGTGPRLLAGMRTDPAGEVRAGRLLEELACQLGTLVIPVPPLRERLADLPLLAEQMLARAGEATGRKGVTLAADAWEVLRGHPWPGNLRDLYDVLASAAARVTGEQVGAADLPAHLRQAHALAAVAGPAPPQPLPLDSILEQAERRLIELALRRCGGHLTRAAASLGIWRQRLKRRMEALGIADPERAQAAEKEDAEPPKGNLEI
jgi:PAS domain S-box-containing protein